MSTPDSGSPDPARQRGVSAPRPQARSAGMAERAPRNESLTDLVRFFQTQNAPADSTTALPTVLSPERPPPPEQQITKELKPLHRRLLQFTQRQKKESAPRSKQDEKDRQMAALQREGYLLPAPKARDSKSSLERTLSRTSKTSKSSQSSKKQDVENIGRPWLDSRGHSKQSSTDTRNRLASFDLSDFGSLVDVSVSMTEFDDTSPPPYQPSTAGGPAARIDQNVNPHPASAPPVPASTETHSTTTTDPPTSSASMEATQGSGSKSDHVRGTSSSSNSSIRLVDQDVRPTLTTSQSQPTSLGTLESSDKSIGSDGKPDQNTQPVGSTPDTSTVVSNGAPSHRSLKLFPDVAPPRISSMNAWRLSSAPRYQTASQAPSVKSNISVEAKGFFKSTEDIQQKPGAPSMAAKSEVAEVQCSGALIPPGSSVEATPAENITRTADKRQSKARLPSLAMGTLQAFPLPAPTRPLPSIPQPSRVPPATPDKSRLTVQMARHKAKGVDLLPGQPSPIAEDPHEPESQATRPATALGFAGEVDSLVDDDSSQSPASIERPHSTSPEQQTPRRRASSIRIPKMHDLVELPRGSEEATPEGEPVADSPVLGQLTPSKPRGKRASRKSLQINSNVDRKNLPFGLPSPPPSGALPPDPSTQTSSQRAMAQRNITAPTGSSNRALEAPFGPAHHRASMVSRSSSSRSSLRHESIPESYEPSRTESPLPSSDDEGFGPTADNLRSRRTVEKQPKRAHPIRHKYNTVDGRTGHARPRYPHPIRSLTPQGRSTHDLDHLASPTSMNSQSTYRSRDPRSNHHTQPEPNHFLEDRVANLERQNQILQAALLAALNAGVKNSGMDDLQAALSPALSAAPTNPYQHQNKYQQQYNPRPESWVSSSRSSEQSGFETPGSVRVSRANIRQLDNMIEDIEGGWLSDKSSLSGPRMARHR